MKKLLALNVAALAMSALLAVLLVRTTSSSAISLGDTASLTRQVNHAQAIRKEMLVMGDSMRGFLLDPTQQREWDAKMAADEALTKAVEGLLASTGDAARKQMADAIGRFDEEHLNPSENRVLEAAKTDREKATHLYFNEYLPLRTKQMAQVEALLNEVQQDATESAAREIASLESVKQLVYWCAGIGLALCLAAVAWAWRTTGSVSGRIESSVTALTTAMQQTTMAAAQVAGSAQSLSQGATEQASSLEQTSASMEDHGLDDAQERREQPRRRPRMMGETEQMVRKANGALGEMVTSMRRHQGIERQGLEDHQDDRRDRLPDQHPRAQRRRRSGARGRRRHGLRGRRRRSPQPGAALGAGRQATRPALIEESMANATTGNQRVRQVGGAIHAITAERHAR